MGSTPVCIRESPDFAVMTPSNRAAFFRLSLLVAERLLNKHLLCHRIRISAYLGMTQSSGLFRSLEKAKQPSDRQKHANRVGALFPECSESRARRALWIASEFFTGSCVRLLRTSLPDHLYLIQAKPNYCRDPELRACLPNWKLTHQERNLASPNHYPT